MWREIANDMIWFVVWNIFFPYIGNVIIPIDFHMFQRGRLNMAQPPTSDIVQNTTGFARMGGTRPGQRSQKANWKITML